MYKHVLFSSLLTVGLLAACSAGESEPSNPGRSNGAPNGDQAASPTDPAAPGNDPSVAAGAGADAGNVVVEQPVTFETVKIAFDDVDAGVRITDQYGKHATFSSDPGCGCDTSVSAGLAASAPNYLFTYYACPTGPTASIFVDFVRPVRNVRFTLVGVNSDAKVAEVRLARGAEAAETRDMIGLGNYTKPVTFQSEAEGVTRLEITRVNDAFGLGFDDLAFDFPSR